MDFVQRDSCFVSFTMIIKLWKSDRPVSKFKQLSKYFSLFYLEQVRAGQIIQSLKKSGLFVQGL